MLLCRFQGEYIEGVLVQWGHSPERGVYNEAVAADDEGEVGRECCWCGECPHAPWRLCCGFVRQMIYFS